MYPGGFRLLECAFKRLYCIKEYAAVHQNAPRPRGFMCVTSHPLGCEAKCKEADRLRQSPGPHPKWPKRVLSLVPPPGYGLALPHYRRLWLRRLHLGIFFEKEASDRKARNGGLVQLGRPFQQVCRG